MARSPVSNLIIYSIAMITLPIVAYFLSRNVLEIWTNRQSANVYSAISSVIVVHIILFCFVYIAYNEDKHLSQEKISKSADKTD